MTDRDHRPTPGRHARLTPARSIFRLNATTLQGVRRCNQKFRLASSATIFGVKKTTKSVGLALPSFALADPSKPDINVDIIIVCPSATMISVLISLTSSSEALALV